MKRLYLFAILLFSIVSTQAQTLLHYWNFNSSADEAALLAPSFTTGGATLTYINAGASAIQFTSNTGQGFETLNENARNADASGSHLRYNNSVGGTLIFALPTTGYKDAVVKYTTRRSSAANGAEFQVIDYSTDGTSYTNFTTVTTDFNAPVLQTLDFSAIPATDNNPNFKIRITFLQGAGGTGGNNRFDNVTLEGTAMPSLSLVHYWNFNSSADEAALLTPSFTTGGGTLTYINAGASAIQFTSNTGQGFETLNENARNADASGSHLRYNNSVGGTLIFALPTTGYENVVVKYTTRRSSVANGAEFQVIDYSTDGTAYTNFTTVTTDFNAPVLQTLDFSSLGATDNNPNFKIRITFLQGAGGTGGNNRFDNFTLDGYSTGGGDITPPTVAFSPTNNSTNVAVSVLPTITFNEDVRLIDNSVINNTNVDAMVDLRLTNESGASVPFDATISGKVITITPTNTLANGQQYYVAVKANTVEDLSGNALATVQSATFTTITPQTQFNAGDIVFVAYRTNASTPDEVAFLTFVNILPGTQINFTDAKYTDNAQPQCTGGFIWTAPASGVAAGSVVTISVDSPFGTNTGTVVGSSFGLSSGGEQVIMYTGTAASPNYITAISTNLWLTSNTICTGSFSKLPAGLVDGQTSINMSTAPGNVAANTVNAYYTGTQAGTTAALRAAILNPANWIGAGAGTPAQQWPTWAFPGPPYVVSATVINQTTLSLGFSTVLDNTSATNVSNYTGIVGLQSATLGADNKTITLVYTTPFTIGSNNSITISGVKDTEDRTMFAPYVFNFTYTTLVSFDKKFVLVQEDAGTLSIKIKIQNPATSSVDLVVKGTPFSTASVQDFTLATQTLNFTGASSNEVTIQIPINNDNLSEQDEYLALSLENSVGVSVTGGQYMTIFIKDNDRLAPVPNKELELTHVGSYDPGSSTAEIVMHDATTQRLFIISSIQSRLDIANFSNPASITPITSVDMTPYGGITSVAVKNGIVAVASPNNDAMANGSVVFFNTNGEFLKQVTVGVLPDMVTFSPDGTKVMTANEGQPNDPYTVDPEGSVSIIDISGGIATLNQTNVTTLLFTDFNGQEAALIASGVRKLKSTSTLSQDFEPEYITIAADSKKAWVTIQENNAIGEINLETKSITSVWPLGKKDLSVFGNGIDASDNSGIVTISNWPIKSFYIPDAIANYTVGGAQYLITANEGDEKEYGGLNERTTVGTVTLDPIVFPHAALLKENHNLGRLRMTNLSGDTDNDGDYDEINIPGGRSFSIWNAATKTKVFDSGDDIERYTSSDPAISALFNADNEGNGFKTRSRAKGPEPEGLTVATIGGKTFAFIALERVGGIMVYNITDPANVKFVDYKNSRSLTSYAGDHGPEGIIFISPENSPNGKAYIAVANEISGTVSVFEVRSEQSITFDELADKTVGDAAFALTATASSGLSVSYSTLDTEVTINNGQVTLVNGGRVTITASQVGAGMFDAAEPVSQSFCVNPAKPVITVTNDLGDPVLHSSAATGNQWYKDGTLVAGAVNATFAISSVGVYTVTSTVEECASVPSDNYVMLITGLEKNPDQRAVQVHPNPATDQVTLTLSATGSKHVSIYPYNGAVKETFTTDQAEVNLSLRSYASGYYIVRVATQNGIYYSKFIKK